MTNPQAHRGSADLIRWLLTMQTPDVDVLVERVAGRLIEEGIGVWRLNVSLLAMHPEVAIRNAWWTREEGATIRVLGMGMWRSPIFEDSPVATLRSGAARVRRRLSGPEAKLDYPICRDLASEGGTDYVAFPLVFTDGRRTFVSLATRDPEGFTDAQLAQLEELLPALAIRVELTSSYFATQSLLQVYLGQNAARRVLAGEFTRGSGTPIRAAVWTCDLRGFTSLSDGRPPTEVTLVLDAYFERVVDAISDHGGEVLKLIGDAVLAIFPAGDDAAGACAAALGAARQAVASMAEWNAGREEPVGLGVGLHFGEVFYGNIGGRERLDFTVIGATVNEVCRLEPLCKTLGMPVVLSDVFAEQMPGERFVDLGEHPLRGVGAPRRVFGLGETAPS